MEPWRRANPATREFELARRGAAGAMGTDVGTHVCEWLSKTAYIVPDRKPRFFKNRHYPLPVFFCAFRLFPGELWAEFSVAARY